MKKIIAILCLGVCYCNCFGQGYVGALIAFTKFNGGCESGLSCGDKPLGMKLFAGTKLPEESVIQLGFGAIDTVEVGAVRFGTLSGHGVTQVSASGASTVEAPLAKKMTSDGIYVVGGAHIPIIERVSFVPKLGVAYVTTSVKTWVNGSSAGNVSENHFAPYGGLGLEYAGPYDIRFSATVDWARSKTQGISAVSSLVGVGAAFGF